MEKCARAATMRPEIATDQAYMRLSQSLCKS
jgi:hypothetical protein